MNKKLSTLIFFTLFSQALSASVIEGSVSSETDYNDLQRNHIVARAACFYYLTEHQASDVYRNDPNLKRIRGELLDFNSEKSSKLFFQVVRQLRNGQPEFSNNGVQAIKYWENVGALRGRCAQVGVFFG